MNFHKIRTTKVSNELIEKFPYFVGEIINRDSMNTRMRGKEFYIMRIISVLHPLSEGDKTFHELFRASGFGYKRGFLNYLDMCREFGFLEKDKLSYHMWYRITDKGRILLELFRI